MLKDFVKDLPETSSYYLDKLFNSHPSFEFEKDEKDLILLVKILGDKFTRELNKYFADRIEIEPKIEKKNKRAEWQLTLEKLEKGSHIAKINNKNEKEEMFINQAKIICTTLSTASSLKLKIITNEVAYLIVDEAC